MSRERRRRMIVSIPCCRLTRRARRERAHSHGRERRYLCVSAHFPQSVDVDGLCTNCGKEGHNRLMLTRIPNFQEVIIVSFECAPSVLP